MKFGDVKENMWVQYDNSPVWIYETTDIHCRAQRRTTGLEYLILYPEDFENKDIANIEPPKYSLNETFLYVGRRIELRDKLATIKAMDEDSVVLPYGVVIDTTTKLWVTPFELQPINY